MTRLFVDAVASKYTVNDDDSPTSSTEESPLVLSSPETEVNRARSRGLPSSRSPGLNSSRSPGLTSSRSPGLTPSRRPWDRSLGLGQPDELSPDILRPFTPDAVGSGITLNLARSKELTPRTKQTLSVATGDLFEILPNTPSETHSSFCQKDSPQKAVSLPDEQLVEVRNAEITSDEVWLLPTEGGSEPQETTERCSVWWRRARGFASLVGEILDFATAVATTIFLIQVCKTVEYEFHAQETNALGDMSVNQQHCREQLIGYRVYYSLGLVTAIPLVVVGIFVPVSLCQAFAKSRNFGRTTRQVLDELGFYQSIHESFYGFCTCIKWGVKIILLAVLIVAYMEAAHDTYLRKRVCHSESIAQAIADWFELALCLRCFSCGWDLLIKVAPFSIAAHFSDISDHELSEVNFERMTQ